MPIHDQPCVSIEIVILKETHGCSPSSTTSPSLNDFNAKARTLNSSSDLSLQFNGNFITLPTSLNTFWESQQPNPHRITHKVFIIKQETCSLLTISIAIPTSIAAGATCALQLEPVVFDACHRRRHLAIPVHHHHQTTVDAIILGRCIFDVQLPTLKIDMRRFREPLVVPGEER